MVFTQYYSILVAAKKAGDKGAGAGGKE
jgi:hypothetical protein